MPLFLKLPPHQIPNFSAYLSLKRTLQNIPMKHLRSCGDDKYYNDIRILNCRHSRMNWLAVSESFK